MYQVVINGETYYDVPASLDDVSISRFIKFRNFDQKNPLLMLQWAINAKPHLIDTPEIEKEISNVFTLIQPVIDDIYAFMKSPEKGKTPDSVNVLGYDVKLKDGLLNDLPYWPYVVTKEIIRQESKNEPFDPTDRFPEVVAHYLYSAVTRSDYDEQKANDFVSVINDVPMVPVIQLANFFLLKQQDLFPTKSETFTQKLMKTLRKRG